MPRILIVGAGAVGCAYAYHAQLGGADVSFLVKPKHVAERKEGIQLYLHRLGKKPEPKLLQDFQLIDSLDSLPNARFDGVLITLPVPALHEGTWLRDLARRDAVKNSLWLVLSPGFEDAEFVRTQTGADPLHVAAGIIPFLSYWAPLPGEELPRPGYAFWLPPAAKFEVSVGEIARENRAGKSSALADRWKGIAGIFSAGGLPTSLVENYRKRLVVLDPLLRCLVAGLEKSEWSFQKFLNGPNLQLASEAAREAAVIYAKSLGFPDPSRSFLKKVQTSPLAIRGMLKMLSKLAPFDVEAFFRVHFTKVETQQHQGIKDLLDRGKKSGVLANNLRALSAGRPASV